MVLHSLKTNLGVCHGHEYRRGLTAAVSARLCLGAELGVACVTMARHSGGSRARPTCGSIGPPRTISVFLSRRSYRSWRYGRADHPERRYTWSAGGARHLFHRSRLGYIRPRQATCIYSGPQGSATKSAGALSEREQILISNSRATVSSADRDREN